jgi:hypothetical protein
MMILRLSVRYLVAFGHIFEIFRITSRLAGLGIGVIVGIARLWFFTRRCATTVNFVFPFNLSEWTQAEVGSYIHVH